MSHLDESQLGDQPCEVCGTDESFDFDTDMPDDLYRSAAQAGEGGKRARTLGYVFARVCGRCRRDRKDEVHALGWAAEGDQTPLASLEEAAKRAESHDG